MEDRKNGRNEKSKESVNLFVFIIDANYVNSFTII